MTPTVEELIENVKSLPKSERKKFFDFVEKEKLQSLAKKDEDEKFHLSMKWIQENRENMMGNGLH